MVLPPDAVPDPASFLLPSLEVIQQELTSRHTTGIALSSINKFLSYRIISVCVCVCEREREREGERERERPDQDHVGCLKGEGGSLRV